VSGSAFRDRAEARTGSPAGTSPILPRPFPHFESPSKLRLAPSQSRQPNVTPHDLVDLLEGHTSHEALLEAMNNGHETTQLEAAAIYGLNSVAAAIAVSLAFGSTIALFSIAFRVLRVAFGMLIRIQIELIDGVLTLGSALKWVRRHASAVDFRTTNSGSISISGRFFSRPSI
jgi:hypothetical protein